MSKTLRRSVALLTLFALILPTAALAQAAGAAEVRGVLLDTGGLPAEGFQIGLRTTDGNLFLSKATPVDGTFVIDGLPPATYELVAFAPDGGEVPVLAKQMALAASQKERVEIRLASDKAQVAGRVPAETTAAGSTASSSTFDWKALGIAAVAIAGGFAIGYWVFEDDDDDVERSASPSLPSRR